MPLRRPPSGWRRRSRCSPTPPTTRGARRVLAVRRVLAGVAGDPLGAGARRAGPVRRPAGRRSRRRGQRDAAGEPSPSGADAPTPTAPTSRTGGRSTRSPRSPRRPATTTPSAGGRTSSSTARTAPSAVRRRIAEAMAARARGRRPPDADRDEDASGARRYMRTVLRRGSQARAPADRRGLRRLARAGARPTAAAGRRPTRALLKGLPKVKVGDDLGAVDARRGSRRVRATAPGSPRPAGTTTCSPRPTTPVPRWLDRGRPACCASEDLPVSSAHVIEAVRLADALAALRGRPLAGLAEVTDATRAVLCDGDDAAARAGRPRASWSASGSARCPDDTPRCRSQATSRRTAAPAAAQAGGARTRRSSSTCASDIDLERSRLLHRLRLLGVDWGDAGRRRGRSTGHVPGGLAAALAARARRSTWSRRSVYGHHGRPTPRPRTRPSRGRRRRRSPSVDRAGRAVPAGRPARRRCPTRAAPRSTTRAALDADVGHLMAALPALARTLRYGDVRGTDTAALGARSRAALRACGSASGCRAAVHRPRRRRRPRQMRDHARRRSHAAIGAARRPTELRRAWLDALERPRRPRRPCTALLAGRVTRLLLDAGRLDADEAAAGSRLALSRRHAARAAAAAWVEGFLAGGGAAAGPRRRAARRCVDAGSPGCRRDAFVDVLPLLRRTFARVRRRRAPRASASGSRRPRTAPAPAAAARRPSTGSDADLAPRLTPASPRWPGCLGD